LIRVVVYAASPVGRAGLAALLRAEADLEVAAEGGDLQAMAELIDSSQAHVVLAMVGSGEEEAFERWLPQWLEAGAKVLLLLDHEGTEWAAAQIGSGASGYLLRQHGPREILAAIQAADAGFQLAPAGEAVPVPSRPRPAPPENALIEPLTPREVEVLRLLADGESNKGIANELGISEHTAKFHVSSVLAKLGAATRTEAVTIGVRSGLVVL